MNKRIGKVALSLPIKGFLYKEEDFKINSRCYTKPVQIHCANKNAFMSFLKVESLVCQTPLARSKIVTNMKLSNFPNTPNMSCLISGMCIRNYAQDVFEFSISCNVAA